MNGTGSVSIAPAAGRDAGPTVPVRGGPHVAPGWGPNDRSRVVTILDSQPPIGDDALPFAGLAFDNAHPVKLNCSSSGKHQRISPPVTQYAGGPSRSRQSQTLRADSCRLPTN
ncbi:hypothetical protein MESS4_360002 [Mesorhizobium sp. STM 4661]|nr:hypothetical protein MESS4_360002 [Mesorhizobium sp. STM 4661]